MGSKASSSLWKEYNALYQKQNLRQQENDKRINYRFIVNAEKKYMHGKARKLLDVGFGSGILMGMLNKRYDVTGIDKDPKSLCCKETISWTEGLQGRHAQFQAQG